jgi:hypothetical protein
MAGFGSRLAVVERPLDALERPEVGKQRVSATGNPW